MFAIEEGLGFDVSSLNAEFNKKIDLSLIYNKILKKYSRDEITRYALVCWYKRKKNVVIIVLTNEKIFIESNKDLAISGVYSYRDVQGIRYCPNKNNKNKSYSILITSEDNYTLKGINKEIYEEFDKIFDNEKEIFNNSKLGKSIMQNINSYGSMDFLKKKEIIEKDEENLKIEEKNDDLNVAKVTVEAENSNLPNKKSKRVVNDLQISNSTAFSSIYIFELLSSADASFPNGQKTILSDFAKKLQILENTSIFNYNIDCIPLQVDSKKNKLNTIPVLAEFTSLKNPNDVETRFFFARNWIEFTKHNVTDKLLGVDSNGNGVYIDIRNIQTSHRIDVYKAKEYKVNDVIRHGLRSSQNISFHKKNQKLGIDSLYVNVKTGQKLDLEKYDGIIFLGIKYYFNVYNEFNTLQRKYVRIFHQEKKHNGETYRSYELIFEDDLVSYKACNEKGSVIDDLSPNSQSYDLRWLTFFID